MADPIEMHHLIHSGRRIVNQPNMHMSHNNFADRIRLTGEAPILAGDPDLGTVYADKEFGEPDHARKAGGASVWWEWKAPAYDGLMTFTVYTYEDPRVPDIVFTPVLGIYTGSQWNELAKPPFTRQG